VLQALDMLSDTDPYNDRQAWRNLSESLLKAGDRVNAVAAYAIMMQEFDMVKAAIVRRASRMPQSSEIVDTGDGNEVSYAAALAPAIAALDINSGTDSPSTGVVTSKGNDEIKPIISSPVAAVTTTDWYCEGQCRRGVEEWKAIHVCETCLSTGFCEECIDLVKENKLPFRVCSPEHTFYQGYPVPEGLGKREDGMVLVGGKVLELDAWLKDLRTEWVESTGTK
jgi:hypothetical protein